MTHLVTLWSRTGQNEITKWEYYGIEKKLLSRLRTTKIDQRPMVFTVLLGIDWETANGYETNVTSLLNIMARHCISGTVGCV